MPTRRPATEPEVILTFLRGELSSARFGDAVRAALQDVGGLQLVTDADITSTEQNEARREALRRARGWGVDAGLFTGFPQDVEWSHGTLTTDELARVRYIRYSYWIELSGGSRRPSDVLATIRSGDLPEWLRDLGTDWCFEFAARFRQDDIGDLIILGTPSLDQLVVLEGHARLTALFVARADRTTRVSAFIGTSPNIYQWKLF